MFSEGQGSRPPFIRGNRAIRRGGPAGSRNRATEDGAGAARRPGRRHRPEWIELAVEGNPAARSSARTPSAAPSALAGETRAAEDRERRRDIGLAMGMIAAAVADGSVALYDASSSRRARHRELAARAGGRGDFDPLAARPRVAARRALEQRLERLAAWFNPRKEHAEREDEAVALRRIDRRDGVRDGLLRAGIDPRYRRPCCYDGRRGEPRIASCPSSSSAERKLRLLYERLRRYRDGPPPDHLARPLADAASSRPIA